MPREKKPFIKGTRNKKLGKEGGGGGEGLNHC